LFVKNYFFKSPNIFHLFLKFFSQNSIKIHQKILKNQNVFAKLTKIQNPHAKIKMF